MFRRTAAPPRPTATADTIAVSGDRPGRSGSTPCATRPHGGARRPAPPSSLPASPTRTPSPAARREPCGVRAAALCLDVVGLDAHAHRRAVATLDRPAPRD